MTAAAPVAAYDPPWPDTLMVLGVTGLLALQIVNLATFNLQPGALRTAVDAASLLGYGGLFALTLLYASGATVLHICGFILFLGAAIIGLVRNPDGASLTEMIKTVTGPMVLGILTARWKPPPPRLSLWLFWLVTTGAVLLGAYVAFTGEPYISGGNSQRLAVFAGGETGLHPSAYAMTCFFFLMLVMLRARVGLWFVSLGILAVAGAAILGYEVRTTWLMILIFAAVLSIQWLWHRSGWFVVGAVGLALIAVAGALLMLVNANFDLGSFSSGRTIAYMERLQLIGARDAADFLFGTGSGTDAMRGINIWRWEEKDSHNDFMTLLIELGAIGLIGFGMMLAAALWAAPTGYKGWVLMMIVSAAVSNGVLLRPSIAPALILTAWVAFALRKPDSPPSDEWAAPGYPTG